MGLGVSGLGFRVQGLGVKGFGGLGVLSLEFRGLGVLV